MKRLKAFLVGFLFFVLSLISQFKDSSRQNTNLDKYQFEIIEIACYQQDISIMECK